MLDWNEMAISFYHRIGAKPMDEWTTFRLTGPALQSVASETVLRSLLPERGKRLLRILVPRTEPERGPILLPGGILRSFLLVNQSEPIVRVRRRGTALGRRCDVAFEGVLLAAIELLAGYRRGSSELI